MTEQWQELKETIIEMRDNNGTGTQQEVCKFLANLMEILEKQMQEPTDDYFRKKAGVVISQLRADRDRLEDELAKREQEPKTGHWIAIMMRTQKKVGMNVTVAILKEHSIQSFAPIAEQRWLSHRKVR